MHTLLERRTLRFSSYQNQELKVKLGWAGARKRKKTAFFVTFILSNGNLSNICVYLNAWIRLLNKLSEYIYFYILQKVTLQTFLLVFKIVKSLQTSDRLSLRHFRKSRNFKKIPYMFGFDCKYSAGHPKDKFWHLFWKIKNQLWPFPRRTNICTIFT